MSISAVCLLNWYLALYFGITARFPLTWEAELIYCFVSSGNCGCYMAEVFISILFKMDLKNTKKVGKPMIWIAVVFMTINIGISALRYTVIVTDR